MGEGRRQSARDRAGCIRAQRSGPALSLPVSIARLGAAGMARGMANVGRTVIPTALGAFSNDRTRQERLLFVIPTLARHDAARARALIDTYITEPDIRERVERAYQMALDLPPP